MIYAPILGGRRGLSLDEWLLLWDWGMPSLSSSMELICGLTISTPFPLFFAFILCTRRPTLAACSLSDDELRRNIEADVANNWVLERTSHWGATSTRRALLGAFIWPTIENSKWRLCFRSTARIVISAKRSQKRNNASRRLTYLIGILQEFCPRPNNSSNPIKRMRQEFISIVDHHNFIDAHNNLSDWLSFFDIGLYLNSV